jgi:hypothetical protein
VRITQYTYFALSSTTVSAAEITAVIGLAPDTSSVRGARRADPPVPVNHSWHILCKEPGLRVDEQVTVVLERIAPYADRLRALVEARPVCASLRVVRYFEDDDGAMDADAETVPDTSGEREYHEPVTSADGATLTVIPGQHQLLGFHLTPSQLGLLASLHAGIDADEYG